MFISTEKILTRCNVHIIRSTDSLLLKIQTAKIEHLNVECKSNRDYTFQSVNQIAQIYRLISDFVF